MWVVLTSGFYKVYVAKDLPRHREIGITCLINCLPLMVIICRKSITK